MEPEPTMPASEYVASPLELSEAVPPEQRLEAVRELMMNGYPPILEACLDNLPLPAQREAFFVEAAHFLIYFLAVRLNDDRSKTPELKHLMQSFRTIHRMMERDVIERFTFLQQAYRAGELG